MHDIVVNTPVLQDNQAAAMGNRRLFQERGLYVCNIMSGPGAGKTTLLEQTLEALQGRLRVGIIEGDLQTSADADRLAKLGAPTYQINTGGACHLDARLIHDALHHFDLDMLDALIIENVGNLVCPAEFDLGEHDKIMLLSVTEGDDKPSKYPLMFHEARVLLLNKMDLIDFTNFDADRAIRDARDLNLDLDVFPVSCRTGDGLDAWFSWLTHRIDRVRNAAGLSRTKE